MTVDDPQVIETVKEYYRKTAKQERVRLRRNPYHQIEFIVTMHFLEKYLPKSGLVLDAGGGPGRYAVELAKKGYDIVLLDLTPELLRIAEREIVRANVRARIRQIKEGSITDLSEFADKSFDAVLCLGGPLNHVLEDNRRDRAVTELVRVAKVGSPLFVSVISRLGVLRSIFLTLPNEIQDCRHHLEDGNYVPGTLPRHRVMGFTAAHWFLPEELRQLCESHGLDVLEMAAVEGLSSHHSKEINRLAKDRRRWKMWMEILLLTCTHPSIIGSSEHLLLMGRKR